MKFHNLRQRKSLVLNRWMSGWMDGWMDGWMEAKAGLRIAYNNQKYFFTTLGCLLVKLSEKNCQSDFLF